MSARRLAPALLGLCLWTAPRLFGQTPTPTPSPTTVGSGVSIATENNHAVTGVRIEPRPDGTVWFLVPSNDRIVQLQPDGVTLKQWQIRDDKNLGANPVDFEIDGDVIWFIENGESQIDAGYSAFGRLDTSTGQLHEWVVPGSRPAGFVRTPDGKVWLPQTGARLQSLDLATGAVVDYRSTQTFAYSDVVAGPDGALWMSDFGNNRIVRYVPGAATETAWTLLDANAGRLNPAQLQFDEKGFLWISEITAGRMDRLDPSTGALTSFGGFSSPIHFDIFAGRVYVTEANGGNGTVVVLDPARALGLTQLIAPQTNDVASLVNRLATTTRDSTITPTTFTSAQTPIAAADLTASNPGAGLLRTSFPFKNAYGISAAGGVVWVGTDGHINRLTLQSIGSAADLTVPVALQFGTPPGPGVAIDLTLFNRGTAPLSVDALYLFSPAAFAQRVTVTVAPGATVLVPDAFKDTSSNSALMIGPVRFSVTSGNAADLVASVRSSRRETDGSSFGFSMPAAPSAEILGTGATATLFCGARSAETSILGVFSPAGGSGTATLIAPDGTVRGTRTITLAANIAEEFNPAASAFGVAPEVGDVVRITVSSGSLQPYVEIFDTGSGDVAAVLPAAGTTDAVIPNVGEVGTFVSDLFLSNTSSTDAAQVRVTFAPLSSTGIPALADLTLPPGGSRVVSDVLPSLFGVSSGQGTLGIESTVPIAAGYRVASRREDGDYAGFATALSGGEAIPGGAAALAIGVPQTATRRTHLLLYNRGAPGTVTVIGYDADGNEIGRLALPVAASESTRVNSILAAFGATPRPVGRIRVETTAGMQVYAMTAEVDADTGDLDIQRLRSVP